MLLLEIYDKVSVRIGIDLPGYALVRAKEALAEVEDRLIEWNTRLEAFLKKSQPMKHGLSLPTYLSGKREPYRKFLPTTWAVNPIRRGSENSDTQSTQCGLTLICQFSAETAFPVVGVSSLLNVVG